MQVGWTMFATLQDRNHQGPDFDIMIDKILPNLPRGHASDLALHTSKFADGDLTIPRVTAGGGNVFEPGICHCQ